MKAALAAYGNRVCRAECHLGAFGACTPKPVVLYGTAPWLVGTLDGIRCSPNRAQEIRDKGVKTAHVYYDAQGRKRVQGSKELKATQEYPLRFGRAVARAHCDALREAQVTLQHEARPIGHEVVYWGQGHVADLFRALPAEYQLSLRDAWWLADFVNDRVWMSGYGDEAALKAPGPGRARKKAKAKAKHTAAKAKAKAMANRAAPAASRSSSTGSSSSSGASDGTSGA